MGCIRDADTVARLGGDEFAIVLSHLQGREGAEVVAQKILHALEEPLTLNEQTVYFSASIGIALYPADATSAESLVGNADSAMYQAKQTGRRRYCLYDAKS